jgi:GNAT superfamily N-acetyltransferase
MEIRPATPADVEVMSRLAQALVTEYISPDLSPTAAVMLYRSMGADAIAQAMATTVRYHVATIAADIVGLIGIQNHRHVYHLFVAATHHRQGIARALWQTAVAQGLAAGNSGEFTVNSSRYAQPVYEKLGFVQSGAAPSHGIVSVPMTFKCAARPSIQTGDT